MKNFLKIFISTLILVECFLFFGGGRLFEFSKNYYLSGASVSFLLSILIYVLYRQADEIDLLRKRIEVLEKKN